MMWPLGFLFVCIDLSSLDIYDFIFLLALGALATWATMTSRKWVRLLVAAIFFAVILIVELNCEPISRYLVSHHPDRNKGFLEGVDAMLSAIKSYRPYVVVAAIGLFSISISCNRKDENMTPRKGP